MKTKQWKKAAALMSAGAMTASVFAAPLAVKADDKVTNGRKRSRSTYKRFFK